MVASYLFSEEVVWYFYYLFLKCLKGFPKNCSLFFLLKYNWFTWYLLSYLGHQWSCLGQESPFGENVNCEFVCLQIKNLIFYVFFNFFASFGNLCPSRFFSISLVIFIGLKLFIIFPYYSLTSVQYLMSHLFLILAFYVFSFFHSVSLVKSISFDWALQKKQLWFH